MYILKDYNGCVESKRKVCVEYFTKKDRIRGKNNKNATFGGESGKSVFFFWAKNVFFVFFMYNITCMRA